MDRGGLRVGDDFVKALLFPFVLAEKKDAPSRFPPLGQLFEEAFSFDFIDYEVAGVKNAETGGMACGIEVLDAVGLEGGRSSVEVNDGCCPDFRESGGFLRGCGV